MAIKNKQELNELKSNWLLDPSWDIEQTEGFSEHYNELLNFRLEKEEGWERDRQRLISEKATKLKISNELAEYILTLEFRLNVLECKV